MREGDNFRRGEKRESTLLKLKERIGVKNLIRYKNSMQKLQEKNNFSFIYFIYCFISHFVWQCLNFTFSAFLLLLFEIGNFVSDNY